jgi:hypothetical protein
MVYHEDLERYYFWCGKYVEGSQGRKLYGKVKRTCFEICEKNCKKFKDILECENYFEALEEATAPPV